MATLIKYSKRKTVTISVNENDDIIIKAPKYACIFNVGKLVLKHNDWIIRQKIKNQENRRRLYELNYNPEMIDIYKKLVFEKVKTRIDLIARELGVNFKKVRLSNARKRWGSCNSNGVISLNWRLYFVTDNELDYVVLHEVMHLRHMNHSKAFWADMNSYMPDFNIHKGTIRKKSHILML